MSGDYKSLNLRPETWQNIRGIQRPGETLDEVISRLLGEDVDVEWPHSYMTVNVKPGTKAAVESEMHEGESFDATVSRLLEDYDSDL